MPTLKWYEDPKVFREKRMRLGLTQQRLAKKSGVDRTIIANIESGRRKLIGDVATRLWDILDEVYLLRRNELLTPEQKAAGRARAVKKKEVQIERVGFKGISPYELAYASSFPIANEEVSDRSGKRVPLLEQQIALLREVDANNKKCGRLDTAPHIKGCSKNKSFGTKAVRIEVEYDNGEVHEICLTCWNKIAAPPAQGAPTPERLCHQCGTIHIIPEGAECLKAPARLQQEILRIAVKAGITVEWVRENYIPIKRVVAAQGARSQTRRRASD